VDDHGDGALTISNNASGASSDVDYPEWAELDVGHLEDLLAQAVESAKYAL
jgi:hypothetical protein